MKTFVCKLLLFLTVVLAPYNALAYQFEEGNRVKLEPNSVFRDEGLCYHIVSKEDRTAEVIMSCESESNVSDGWYRYDHYNHAGKSLTIPSRCIGDGVTYKVVGIGPRAFFQDKAIEISLPSTISYISDFAFFGAKCETINIPATCSYISESAFRSRYGYVGQDTKINQINIDNPRYTFIDGCLYCSDKFNDKTHDSGDGKPKSLMNHIPRLTSDTNNDDDKELELPQGIEHIFEYAFAGGFARKIIIPNSVDTIGPNAFLSCRFKEITLPTGLKHISNELFTEGYIEQIDIPNGVISIGESAFKRCRRLQKVIIPDGMISIGRSAFEDCTVLTEINLPESITSIGIYAFSESSITHLELPDAIETLDYFFWSFNKLETIKLPRNLKTLDNSNIKSCSKLLKLFCPMETPIPYGSSFSTSALKNATLYVPTGCKEAYEKVDPWRNFWNIEEYTPTVSVEETESEPTRSVIGIYDLNGRAVAEDAPGIKIIRYSDGSVSKSVN